MSKFSGARDPEPSTAPFLKMTPGRMTHLKNENKTEYKRKSVEVERDERETRERREKERERV